MTKAGSGKYRGDRAGCSCVFGALGHFTDSSTHRKAKPDSSTHRKAKPAGRRAVTQEVCARGPRSAVASSVNAPVPPGESQTGADCTSIETPYAQRGGTWTGGLDIHSTASLLLSTSSPRKAQVPRADNRTDHAPVESGNSAAAAPTRCESNRCRQMYVPHAAKSAKGPADWRGCQVTRESSPPAPEALGAFECHEHAPAADAALVLPLRRCLQSCTLQDRAICTNSKSLVRPRTLKVHSEPAVTTGYTGNTREK